MNIKKVALTYLLIALSTSFIYAKQLNKPTLEKEIAQTIIKKLLKNYDVLSKSDIKIDIENLKSKYIPERATSYKLIIASNSNVLGPTILPIKFYDLENKFLSRIHIKIDAKAFTNFIRAKETISKKDIITSQNVKISYETLYSKPYNYIPNLKTVIGKEATRMIPVKSIITKSMIRDVPNIYRDDKITIIIVGTNIKLKVKGIALQAGLIGDSIKVKTLQSKQKILIGEIIANKIVKVDI
jgi:flagellar basal body P-ring formation protein FlgA